MSQFTFPISVDMGSSSTGVYYTFYKYIENIKDSPVVQSLNNSENLKERNIHGKGFVINNSDFIKNSIDQSSRRTHRTARKASQRRKNARKFTVLALESLGISLSKKDKESLSYILNRRGFTYLGIESDDTEKISQLLYTYRDLEEESNDNLSYLKKTLEIFDQIPLKDLQMEIDIFNSRVLKKYGDSSDFLQPIKSPKDIISVSLRFLEESMLKEPEERVDNFDLDEENQRIIEALLSIIEYFLFSKKSNKSPLPKKEKYYNSLESKNLKDAYKKITKNETYEDINSIGSFHFSLIENNLKLFLQQIKEGKRSREKAFEEIEEDLKTEGSLIFNFYQKSIASFLNPKEFLNLIGNILNMQNRYFRKYFSDKKGNSLFREKEGWVWDSSKAFSLYEKYIKRIFSSYNPEVLKKKKNLNKEAENFLCILKSLEDWKKSDKKDNFAWALTQFYFLFSIPPFEVNENRKPPKCRHLYLNKAWVLSFLQGDESILKEISQSLKELYPYYAENLPEFKIKGKISHYSLWVDEETLILHRFLDSTEDLYKTILSELEIIPENKIKLFYLRELFIDQLNLKGSSKTFLKELIIAYQEAKEASFSLENEPVFYKKGKEEPLTLKKAYEIKEAKEIESSPFILCHNNPPRKEKRKYSYLEKYFKDFSDKEKKDFFSKIEETYNKEGSFYKKIKELNYLRNDLGNSLNTLWENSKNEIKSYKKAFKENSLFSLKRREEEEKRLLELTFSLSSLLKDFLPIEKRGFSLAPWESFFYLEEKKDKTYFVQEKKDVINPYILIQMFDLLFNEKGKGFSKECIYCHRENNWRKGFYSEKEEDIYRGVIHSIPLINGGMLPFSGKIRRFCDSLALKMAKILLPNLKKEILSFSSEETIQIKIPLYAEKNTFTFEENKKDIKKKFKKKQGAIFNSRLEEVKTCPYTGEILGLDFELDHIISRHYSGQYAGRGIVYNSEVNLISSSPKGNQSKGRDLKNLKNLNEDHLDEVFADLWRGQKINSFHDKIKTIKEFILRSILPYLKNSKSYRNFKVLSEEDKRAFRYILFCWEEEEFKQVDLGNKGIVDAIEWVVDYVLSHHRASKVNGTQKYFLQSFKKKLEIGLKKDLDLKLYQYQIFFTAKVVEGRGFRDTWRNELAKNDPALKKDSKNQSPYSHVLDAYFIYNIGHFLSSYKYYNTAIKNLTDIDKESDFRQTLYELKPQSISLYENTSLPVTNSIKGCNLGSKTLFRSTIYGERFYPFVLSSEGFGIGFSQDNHLIKDPKGVASSEYFLLFEFFRSKNLPLPSQEKKEVQGFYIFKIDKLKAFKFLNDIYHTEEDKKSEEDKEREKLLSKYLYRTERILCDPDFLDLDKIKTLFKKKPFSFFKEEDKKSMREFFTKKNPLSSYFYTWEKLYDLFTKEKQEDPEIKEEEALKIALENLKKSFTSGQKESKSFHKSKGEKFSLLTLSGEGNLRVKRKDSYGKPFFQLIRSETSTKSLILEKTNEDKINFKRQSILKSRALTPFDIKDNSLLKGKVEKNSSQILIKESCFLLGGTKESFISKIAFSYPEGSRVFFYIRFSKENKNKWEELLSFFSEENKSLYANVVSTPSLFFSEKEKVKALGDFIEKEILFILPEEYQKGNFAIGSINSFQPKVMQITSIFLDVIMKFEGNEKFNQFLGKEVLKIKAGTSLLSEISLDDFYEMN